MSPSRAIAAVGAVVACALPLPSAASAQNGTVREAECSEGVITSIELDRGSVFDPESTSIGALAWTYRALNVLHVRTSPAFIRNELLFREGDCLDPFLLSESARLLDQYGFLAQAEIEYEPDDDDGGYRVIVSTRDEWSTKVDIGGTYDAGLNLERFQVTEENFLGRGIFAEFTHRERREVRRQSIGLATPRFFGRADASIAWGRDRPGNLFDQYVRYPFVGETGSFSIRQGFHRSTRFFSYATEGAEPFTQVLLPSYRELAELSFARRLGGPGHSIIVGISLSRDVVDFPAAPEIAFGTDFDELQLWAGPYPAELIRQQPSSGTTRVGLQLGTRRFEYAQYVGLDGVRERQQVGLGWFGGVTVGRGLDLFVPDDVTPISDTFLRAHLNFGLPVGSSLFHGVATAEGRRQDGTWRDGLLDADLVGYLRNASLPSHTLFVRASIAGGWETTLPFQLSLGGREGVRALAEDRYPGGRMARFVVEDRIVFPWPDPDDADLGMTVFADVGRVWPGDVPYGVDSGWQTGIGFGLRVGMPAGTRNVWRTDVVFPVGNTEGGAIFRVTFELNRLRTGFFTADVLRSRRLDLGPDHF